MSGGPHDAQEKTRKATRAEANFGNGASEESRNDLPVSDDIDDYESPCCDECGEEMELVEVWTEGKGFVYRKDLDES